MASNGDHGSPTTAFEAANWMASMTALSTSLASSSANIDSVMMLSLLQATISQLDSFKVILKEAIAKSGSEETVTMPTKDTLLSKEKKPFR